MTEIEITVTQEDIDHGVRANCRRCPVALAAMRALPGKAIQAEPGWIVVNGQSSHFRADLKRFVQHFDWGLVSYPETFTLTFKEDPRCNA